MPLDPSAKRLLDLLGAAGAVARGTADIAGRRQGFRNLMRFGPAPDAAVAAEDHDVSSAQGRVPVRILRPPQKIPGAAMLYCHGGGLVAGGIDTHDPLCRALAVASGVSIVLAEYRLAPEHSFPAALEDCLAVADWLALRAGELGFDAGQIGIGGDSAGGALAAVACAMAAAREKPRFAFQFLLCPILDYAFARPSRAAFATPILDEAMLQQDVKFYLPTGPSPQDPRVSPLHARHFVGLPPTFLHIGECDPLHDEGLAYAEALQQASVPVAFTCHAGMPHLFYAMGRVVPYSSKAIAGIGGELKSFLTSARR